MRGYKPAFEKPKKVRYVDMAIYIDKTIYKEDITLEEQELVYKYIYLLCYMFSVKGRYFQDLNVELNDEFALFAASKIYLRMTDSRQFENKEGERKLDPIKSVLNYIKLTIYGMKVDFQKEAFSQVLNPAIDNRIDPDKIKDNMRSNIQCNYNAGLSESIVEDIKNLPNLIKNIINKTPYKKDPIMNRRLYISCLISFLKSITLSNKNIEKLRKYKERKSYKDEVLYKIYNQEKEESTTLWHLESNMLNYVMVLNSKIREAFNRELKDTRFSYQLSEDAIEDIIMSVYDNYIGKEPDDIEQ